MKYFDWDQEKNAKLKKERGISFEDIIVAMESGNVLGVKDNYNQKKYPRQKMYIAKINNYIFLVPFVEDEDNIFLKTIIPSRKATKKYLLNK